jgi:hypothetical protein
LLKENFSLSGIAGLRSLRCGLVSRAETSQKQDAWNERARK